MRHKKNMISDQPKSTPVVLKGHRRVRSYSAAFLFMIFLGITFMSNLGISGIWPVIGIYLLLWIQGRFTTYTLYNDRIDIKKGVLFRSTVTVWLWRIEDIVMKRSIFNLFTGDATLVLLEGANAIMPDEEATAQLNAFEGGISILTSIDQESSTVYARTGIHKITGLFNHRKMEELRLDLLAISNKKRLDRVKNVGR